MPSNSTAIQREQQREAMRDLRHARREDGLCSCGRPRAGDRFRTCRGCRVMQSARQRKAYWARKEGADHGLA